MADLAFVFRNVPEITKAATILVPFSFLGFKCNDRQCICQPECRKEFRWSLLLRCFGLDVHLQLLRKKNVRQKNIYLVYVLFPSWEQSFVSLDFFPFIKYKITTQRNEKSVTTFMNIFNSTRRLLNTFLCIQKKVKIVDSHLRDKIHFLHDMQKKEDGFTKGTSINDVPRFLAIFDLPTYLVLLYNVPFWRLSWTPLPTLISDVINGRSLKR